MDYGFLDIGRDKANRLFVCFHQRMDSFSASFFLCGESMDVQCNRKVEIFHVFHNVPVEVFFLFVCKTGDYLSVILDT